jgi:hypothetical protein
MFVFGAIVALGVNAAIDKEAPCPEQKPCLEPLLALRQVDQLQAKLKEQEARCNLAHSIDRSLDEQRQAEQRERQRLAKEKQRIEAERRALIERVKTGELLISEWLRLVGKMTKTEVVSLLGPPDGKLEPRSSDEYSLEMWSYRRRVRMEDGSPKRRLILYFQKDRVEKIVAVRD